MFDELQKPLLKSKSRKTPKCVVYFNETSHNKRAQTKVKRTKIPRWLVAERERECQAVEKVNEGKRKTSCVQRMTK